MTTLPKTRRISVYSPMATLVLILAFAFFLRVAFFAGVVNQEDLIHLERVSNAIHLIEQNTLGFGRLFQQARLELGGLSDLFVLAPNMAAFYLLGETQFTSLLPSILYSIVSVWLVFAITRKLVDSDSTALLAALFWAYFPLEIFFSTSSPGIITQTTAFLFSIWVFLHAAKKKSSWEYLLLLVTVPTIYLANSWLLVALAILYISLHLLGDPSRKIRNIHTTDLFAGLLFVGLAVFSKAFLGFYHLVLAQTEFVFLLPLFLVGLLLVPFKQPKGRSIFLVWIGAILMSLLANSYFGDVGLEVDIFGVGAYLYLAGVPFSILVGALFSSRFNQRQISLLIWSLVILGAVLVLWGVGNWDQFLPPLDTYSRLTPNALLVIFHILSGVVFAVALAGPLFMSGPERRWKIIAGFCFFYLIFLALLPSTWDRRNEFRYLNEAPAAALAFIRDEEIPLPIYVLNESTFDHVSYLTAMDGSGDLQEPQRITMITGDQLGQLDEGVLLTYDGDAIPISNTWWRMGAFGPLGEPRIVVYRILSEQKAEAAIKDLEKPVGLASRDAYFFSYYGDLVNVGALCEAYASWEESVSVGSTGIETIPYDFQSDCLVLGDDLTSLAELRNAGDIQGYVTFPGQLATLTQDPPVLTMKQISLPVFDMRTVSQDLVLEPNTLYLYTIEIQTPSPTAVLFWRDADREDYFEMKTYPEWSRVAILLFTPDWGAPQPVAFAPALFKHLDQVNLRNLYIGQVDLNQSFSGE